MRTWRLPPVVLRRLGLQSATLAPGAVLLARRGERWRVDPVDDGIWLVQRGRRRRRTVRRVGGKPARTHLVLDQRAASADMGRHQRALSNYLAAEHIGWMLRELDINCVLDVGANIGQYGRQLRSTGYRGRIVSFEPVAHLADKLRRTAADDPDWHVVQCALGDADEETQINVVPGSMSSLLPSSQFGQEWSTRLRDARPETIRVRRLDEVYEDAVAGLDEPRVYLKMDTQGYDLQTFAGAGARIGDVLGMQSEVSCVPIYDGMPRLPEQISAYEAAGFEITGMYPVTRDPASLRIIEFDVVMVRTEPIVARRAPSTIAR